MNETFLEIFQALDQVSQWIPDERKFVKLKGDHQSFKSFLIFDLKIIFCYFAIQNLLGNHAKHRNLFDLLGYLASFLTWLSLWLVFCICIDDFETKSSPKNKEDICIIIIVNAIHSLASKPNVFADYGLLSLMLYYVVSTHAATSESQITLSHHYCVWTCAQNRLETLGLMFTLLWCHC